MRDFLNSRFAPFASLSFRRFFAAHSISLVGFWAFDLARSWIVVSGLGRATELGLVLMAGAIPGIFFSLYGGVIADRIDARKMMIVTKSILALLSLMLAYYAEFHQIELWHLVVFGFIQGSVTAMDGPIFHATLVRLIPRQDYQQALAISSTLFHASRSLGPIIAGVLIALHGPSAVFLFDGISYFGLIVVLLRLELREVREQPTIKNNPLRDFAEGLRYVFSNVRLRFMMLQLFASLCLIFPILNVILRSYVKSRFHIDGENFGYIFTLPASGALLGALYFAAVKPKKPIHGLRFGIPFAILMILLVKQLQTPLMVGIAMGVAGFAVYFCFASLTVSMNLEVEEKYRGRMTSLLTLGFNSIGPLMSYPIGAISDKLGYETSMMALALIYGTASAIIYLLHAKEVKAARTRVRPL